MIDFRSLHINKTEVILEKNVYDLEMSEYYEYRVPTKYFYSENMKENIYNFFINDFNFSKNHGFNYTV